MPVTRTQWAIYLADQFLGYIESGSRVLDFGAGDGLSGAYLARQRRADVTLLDLQDRNRTALPMRLYDGKTIPFAPDSFDAAFAIAVFHHMPHSDQETLLEQMRAIARRVIIIEDTPANLFRRFFNVIGDTIVNVPKSIRMCYTYRTESEWRDFFWKLGFAVEHAAPVAPWYPIQRTLFVLKRISLQQSCIARRTCQ